MTEDQFKDKLEALVVNGSAAPWGTFTLGVVCGMAAEHAQLLSWSVLKSAALVTSERASNETIEAIQKFLQRTAPLSAKETSNVDNAPKI